MKIRFESRGGFDNVTSWLKRVSSNNPSNALNSIGSEGVRALSSATPKDTGGTAAGWVSKIERSGNTFEVVWMNVANPGSSVNVAKILELGHGTGTGGYVLPKPYIKNAMSPVWSSIDNRIVKEMLR